MEKLIKEWPIGYHIVIKSSPIVPDDRPLTETEYKCIYQKILGFIDTEGYGITEPGVPYLSSYPRSYSYLYIFLVIRTRVIVKYFSACNEIETDNRMCQSDLVLYKYWMTQSGYFVLLTTVALVIGITYGKLLFCNIISEQSKDKKISTREYNDRTVYDRYNDNFSVDCDIPDLNLPPIPIDYPPPPQNKISR